jgi:hypothetical protein
VGSNCQPGAERSKAARLEASPYVGGGNPTGRHRLTVGRAERVRWAGREDEAQWERGSGRLERRRNEWATAGPKGRLGRKR